MVLLIAQPCAKKIKRENRLLKAVSFVALNLPGKCACVSESLSYMAIYGRMCITRLADARVETRVPAK